MRLGIFLVFSCPLIGCASAPPPQPISAPPLDLLGSLGLEQPPTQSNSQVTPRPLSSTPNSQTSDPLNPPTSTPGLPGAPADLLWDIATNFHEKVAPGMSGWCSQNEHLQYIASVLPSIANNPGTLILQSGMVIKGQPDATLSTDDLFGTTNFVINEQGVNDPPSMRVIMPICDSSNVAIDGPAACLGLDMGLLYGIHFDDHSNSVRSAFARDERLRTQMDSTPHTFAERHFESPGSTTPSYSSDAKLHLGEAYESAVSHTPPVLVEESHAYHETYRTGQTAESGGKSSSK